MATPCWIRAAAVHLLPGTRALGSPQWSPACFTHQITCQTPAGIGISHPSFKELRQKPSLSVLHYFSFSQKLILQRSFPTSEVLRKKSDNVFKSPRIRGSVVIFNCPWESPKHLFKYWCLGSPQRFWCIGLGCNLGIRIAQSSPCGANGPQPRLRILLPSAEASCWVWRIKFIPMSTSKYKFLACHPRDKSHRLLFWEVGYYSKILQNAIYKLEKEAKVCSGFYHFSSPSTQLKNETLRK